MFELEAIIQSQQAALVKIESLIYTLQFVAPSKIEAHGNMLKEAEDAAAAVRAALEQTRRLQKEQGE